MIKSGSLLSTGSEPDLRLEISGSRLSPKSSTNMANSPRTEAPTNGGSAAAAFASAAASAAATDSQTLAQVAKRQRRPSVRLGDLGGQPPTTLNDSPLRRSKQRKLSLSSVEPHHQPNYHIKPRAIRTFDDNRDTLASFTRGIRDGKPRVKTNWVFKGDEGESRSTAGEAAGDKGFAEESEESDAPSDWGERRAASRVRVRVSGVGDRDVPMERDTRDHSNRNGIGGGVRSWLEGLGLGLYAAVFEIHGVDGEVLPLLTLEDLRDMGITAVGPRRKMYSEIQKLRSKIK